MKGGPSGLQSGKTWVSLVHALLNNTLEKSRLVGTLMWIKNKARQTEAEDGTLGRWSRERKGLSSSSTSMFHLPLGTCLPRARCCKSSLELPPFTSEYCCLYKKRKSLGRGQLQGRRRLRRRPGLSSGLPGILRVHKWSSPTLKGGQPHRLGAGELAIECCFA